MKLIDYLITLFICFGGTFLTLKISYNVSSERRAGLSFLGGIVTASISFVIFLFRKTRG